jgi:putative endopeptidase
MKSSRFLLASLALLGALRLPAAADDLIPMGFTVDMMDRTVSPGTDFARYAWGGWAAKTEIPPDKSRWGTFDGLADNNWRRIHGILEEAAAHPGTSGSVGQKVGDFYAAAMDLAAVNAAGLKPLAPELAAIAAIANLDDLARYVADAQAHIGSPLFGTNIYADQKRNDTIILYLNQGGLSLPTRDYYFDEKYAKFRTGLVEHIGRMLQFTGESAAAAQEDATTILALETKLAEVSKTTADLRDPEANYHKMSIDDAASGCGAFPLKVFLSASRLPATEHEVVVGQPEFFE